MKRLDRLLLIDLFAISLALRIIFSLHFDGLYGQDPYAYYNFGQALRTAVNTGQAPAPFFWPLGYPLLLAIGFTLFGQTPLTAQAISFLFGAALAPLIYLLARQIGAGRAGASAAGLIMAVCGQAIQSSIVVMADIPALFWAAVSAVLLLHSLRDQRRRWYALAAAALALACVNRWLYLALIPVWGRVSLLTWGRLRWRAILIAAGAAACIFLPQAAFSLGSPYPVLNHAWVEGWSPANVFAHEFTNVDGHFVYPQINAVFYAMPYYDPYYLAPLFAPFALIGLWVLRRQTPRLALLLGWGVLPYVFLAGIPYQNIRFPLIVVPAVAVLAGLGLEAALKRWRLIFAAVVIAGLALSLHTDKPMIQTFITDQQRDKIAVQWAIDHIPADARLYTFGLTEPLKAYAPFEVRELYDETPLTLAAELSDGKSSYLYINAWSVEHQWKGMPLYVTYHWLTDIFGADYLARSGNYALFKVRQ